jgi:hypothetical protein
LFKSLPDFSPHGNAAQLSLGNQSILLLRYVEPAVLAMVLFDPEGDAP